MIIGGLRGPRMAGCRCQRLSAGSLIVATSPASADAATVQVGDDGSATWSYDCWDGAAVTEWDLDGSPDEARRRASRRAVEQAAAPFSAAGAAGVPGFRMVIGVDGDLRAWVRVANTLLDRIASGAVRAGSRVPPVAGLGLASPVAAGATARAFRALADEGVLCWVPGRGYHVRTRFTVSVSDRPREDGGLTAVLPGGGPRHA